MSDGEEEMKYKATPLHARLNAELVRRVPALRAGYLEIRRVWDDEEPGPHVVYGDLLVPYLVDKLAEPSGSPEVIGAFDLLEDLLLCGDTETREVVGASVLEQLSGEPRVRMRAVRYMRPMTRDLAAQVFDGWR